MYPLARTLLVELRGTTPTSVASQSLGYEADIYADWEVGSRWPTAGEAFRVCETFGTDVPASLMAFDNQSASHFREPSDSDVARWLSALAVGTDTRTLARAVGKKPNTVKRWLRGAVRPSLPEMLSLVQHAHGGAETLVRLLLPQPPAVAAPQPVDVKDTPHPVSLSDAQRILFVLLSEDYGRLYRPVDGWLAARTRLSQEVLDSELILLTQDESVVWRDGRWVSEITRHAFSLPDDGAPPWISPHPSQVAVSVDAADVAMIEGLRFKTKQELTRIEATTSARQVLLLVSVDA